MDIKTMTPAQQINKLFILANLQENIIMQIKEPQYRHLAKQHFGKAIREIKLLNKFVNNHLTPEEVEGFDKLTEMIDELLTNYME